MSAPTPGSVLALAAQTLIGVRFRLHGRDPDSGLDCIGLLAAAMAAVGRPLPLPNGYPLRLRDIEAFRPLAGRCGFAEASGPLRPGDVVIFMVGPAQFHLGIAAPAGGVVHAHAGLRRVVAGPVPAEWSPVGHWRLTSEV